MRTKNVVLSCCLIVVIGLSLGNGCPPSTPPVTGNVANGQALFNSSCSAATCHPSAAALKPSADNIISNLGSLNSRMSGITLTAQQIADLRAFLATQ
jgi:hypothetical protein